MKRIANWILGKVHPMIIYLSDKSEKLYLVDDHQMYHVLKMMARYEDDPVRRTDLLIQAEKYAVAATLPNIPQIVKIPPRAISKPEIKKKLTPPKIFGTPISTIIMVLMTLSIGAQVGPPHIELTTPLQEHLKSATEPIPMKECYFLLTEFDRDPYDPLSVVIGHKVVKVGELILCEDE